MNEIQLQQKHSSFEGAYLLLKHIKMMFFFLNSFNWILIPIYFFIINVCFKKHRLNGSFISATTMYLAIFIMH